MYVVLYGCAVERACSLCVQVLTVRVCVFARVCVRVCARVCGFKSARVVGRTLNLELQ